MGIKGSTANTYVRNRFIRIYYYLSKGAIVGVVPDVSQALLVDVAEGHVFEVKPIVAH